MSEQRFEFYSDDYMVGVLDTVTGRTFNSFEIVDKLNEQQSTIQSLQREIEELGISIKLFEDDIATKDKKIDDQQSTIGRLERRIKFLEKLAEVQ